MVPATKDKRDDGERRVVHCVQKAATGDVRGAPFYLPLRGVAAYYSGQGSHCSGISTGGHCSGISTGAVLSRWFEPIRDAEGGRAALVAGCQCSGSRRRVDVASGPDPDGPIGGDTKRGMK